jgi:Cu-Zn family superoxide dismutase
MKQDLKFMSVLVVMAAFAASPLSQAADSAHGEKKHVETWSAVKEAVAVLHPTAGNKAHGKVTFKQDGDSVKVVAHVEGLTPGQKHAFHVHQFGDCSAPDGMSAGGHYNPENHPHGLPDKDMRHAGDLGNLEANSGGIAHYEITVKNVSVAGTRNPIIGRAVIVHAKVDDGGQPVGNAGGRIACGVIGVANTAEKK